jgi:hypothetical protein
LFVHVVKKFGYIGGSVCEGNTGSRFGFEVLWNTRLNILMKKNITKIESIYSLVRKLTFEKLVSRFRGNIRFFCGGLKSM